MIASLEKDNFLEPQDQHALKSLGLPAGTTSADARRALGALMLAPAMEICARDRVTSPSEFAAMEDLVRRIEREFELASKEELEAVGTEMGMLPMIQGSWDTNKFRSARSLLASLLARLDEQEAHAIRNAIAKACLDAAQAGSGHLINVHVVGSNERPLIHEIVHELKLDMTSEGLHLLGKAGDV